MATKTSTIKYTKRPQWPKPTVETPDMDTIEWWLFDSVCEATDGCQVEPDGVCQHGHPSWLLKLGLM